MSIVYSADVFCDGPECSLWSHGATGSGTPPSKSLARKRARCDQFVHHNRKDYCPKCFAEMFPEEGKE